MQFQFDIHNSKYEIFFCEWESIKQSPNSEWFPTLIESYNDLIVIASFVMQLFELY